MPSMPNSSPGGERRRRRSGRQDAIATASCESSVSSACASTPLASAASIGPATRFDPTTVAVPFPAWARAKRSAAWPGGSSEPGDHRGKRVEDVMLGVLEHVGRQRQGRRARHVGAERGHHRPRRLGAHAREGHRPRCDRPSRRAKNVPASDRSWRWSIASRRFFVIATHRGSEAPSRSVGGRLQPVGFSIDTASGTPGLESAKQRPSRRPSRATESTPAG